MSFFALNAQYDEWNKVLQATKLYEESSKALLVIGNCSKLKGASELNDKLVYDRVIFECKAGAERPTQSIEIVHLPRINEIVQLRLAFANNKLVVKEVNLNHQYHMCDQNTYPENVRLSSENVEITNQMIVVGGNKQKIKTYLTKKTGKPVLMKTLQNLQTKQNKDKIAPADEIYKLYDILAEIPNANVCFVSDEDDVLIGIFFQDARMAYFFSKYPEIILYDATYKLNNRDMPLFTQCIVNGNGETEVISLYICKSESGQSIGAMLEVFKHFNKKFTETIVIIGDKYFADRSVYQQHFPDAKL